MNITIQRLADHTGLSTATISRILNGKGAHSADTIARVKRVMHDLSWRGKTGVERECIGIVLLAYPRFLNGAYTYVMLSAMLEVLAEAGMVAQIIPIDKAPLTLEDAELLVEKFNLRGILVQELSSLEQMTEVLDKLPVPVVHVGDVRTDGNRHIVHCDNRRLGNNAAAYLWNLGFRDFGVIYYGRGDYGQEQRKDGFIEQVIRCGGEPDRIWVNQLEHIDLERVTTCLADFMKLDPRPQTLFFAVGGKFLRLFLSQLQRNHVEVLRNLFVLGVENSDELQDAALPIASIPYPTRELGRSAATMLIDLILHGEKQVEGEKTVCFDFRVDIDPTCLLAIREGK